MPAFRIIVTEHTESPKTGNFVEKLGTYNPKSKERNLNGERIKYWLSVGAKASGTMHNMLISAGIIEGKKVNVLPRKSPPKKEEVAEDASAATVAATTATTATTDTEEKPTSSEIADTFAESNDASLADAGAAVDAGVVGGDGATS